MSFNSGLGDILSLALQQTGVEEHASVHTNQFGNSALSTDIGSLTAGLFSNYPNNSSYSTPTPDGKAGISGVPGSDQLLATNGPSNVIIKTEDPSPNVCESYISPSSTNVKLEPFQHASHIPYGEPGLSTNIKNEPIGESQYLSNGMCSQVQSTVGQTSTVGGFSIDDLNLIEDDIDLDDILDNVDPLPQHSNMMVDPSKVQIPTHSNVQASYLNDSSTSTSASLFPQVPLGTNGFTQFPQAENSSDLPQLLDDDLSRILEATGNDFFDSLSQTNSTGNSSVSADNMPTVQTNDYVFPPRHANSHYTTYGGVNVRKLLGPLESDQGTTSRLVTSTGSAVNSPFSSGDHSTQLQSMHRHPQAMARPPGYQASGMNRQGVPVSVRGMHQRFPIGKSTALARQRQVSYNNIMWTLCVC